MKRIIALMLVLSMMIVPLAACSGDTDTKPKENSGATTTVQEETTADTNAITTYLEPMSDELVELDYGGESIHILSRNEKRYVGEAELWVEELTNDPVNDAIYNRNLAVSELLGVKITETRVEGASELQKKVDLMVHSGDHAYDIVAASVAYGTPMINDGLVYNL